MADVVGIDIEKIESLEESSGGGQYIIKNTTNKDWEKIYHDSYNMYHAMRRYNKEHPIDFGHIQFWTAEMWSLLWNIWILGKETKIIKYAL